MDLMKVLTTRYATKKFDPSKPLTQEEITQLDSLLQLSPSSSNTQPWQFILATTTEGKERIAQCAPAGNQPKILNASAVVVFASRADVSETHLLDIVNKEDADGRYAKTQFRDQTHNGRLSAAANHNYSTKDYQQWTAKQVYLNAGFFLMGIATMGLDSNAMEGVDTVALDKALGLREKGYTTALIISVGHRLEGDFNATLPKSRLPKEQLIEHI